MQNMNTDDQFDLADDVLMGKMDDKRNKLDAHKQQARLVPALCLVVRLFSYSLRFLGAGARLAAADFRDQQGLNLVLTCVAAWWTFIWTCLCSV